MSKDSNIKGTKNTKSTLVKDTLILGLITLVAGFCLALAYEVTAPIIAETKAMAQAESYKSVYAEAEKFVSNDELKEQVGQLFTSDAYGTIVINEVFAVEDGAGNAAGHVMSISTRGGYNGNITLSLGYSSEGILTGMEILESGETPGFGAKASEPEFKGQFSNQQAQSFTAGKSEGEGQVEVDGITGATVTTTAVIKAINAAIEFSKALPAQ